MRPFQNSPEEWARLDFRLLQNGACHLYWRALVLDEDARWLQEHGYALKSFDCGAWTDESAMHTALAQALNFPEYYGRNLDALNDCLTDVCDEKPAVVLCFTRFDRFARRHPQVAHALLDIIETASRRGLLFGARLVALVQSEDPRLELPAVGASAVNWNPREVLASSRGP